MDGCEILTARIVTSISFHIIPFRMVHKYQSFGTACCLHHQISNKFAAQLTLSGHPWKWRQKISPNLGTYTLIRMRCHILRDAHLRIAWWSHVRRHNNTRLYELNKILPDLQPRWVTFIQLILSPRSFKTQAMSILTTSHQAMEPYEGEDKEKCTTALTLHTPPLTLTSNYSKSKPQRDVLDWNNYSK
jgi:hypothetical protein